MKSDEILAKELIETANECCANIHPEDFSGNECPEGAFIGTDYDDYDCAKCWLVWARKKAESKSITDALNEAMSDLRECNERILRLTKMSLSNAKCETCIKYIGCDPPTGQDGCVHYVPKPTNTEDE